MGDLLWSAFIRNTVSPSRTTSVGQGAHFEPVSSPGNLLGAYARAYNSKVAIRLPVTMARRRHFCFDDNLAIVAFGVGVTECEIRLSH